MIDCTNEQHNITAHSALCILHMEHLKRDGVKKSSFNMPCVFIPCHQIPPKRREHDKRTSPPNSSYRKDKETAPCMCVAKPSCE